MSKRSVHNPLCISIAYRIYSTRKARHSAFTVLFVYKSLRKLGCTYRFFPRHLVGIGWYGRRTSESQRLKITSPYLDMSFSFVSFITWFSLLTLSNSSFIWSKQRDLTGFCKNEIHQIREILLRPEQFEVNWSEPGADHFDSVPFGPECSNDQIQKGGSRDWLSTSEGPKLCSE